MESTNLIKQAIRALSGLLPSVYSNESVTFQQIEESVDFILQHPKFKEVDKNQLIREVETLYNIRVN